MDVKKTSQEVLEALSSSNLVGLYYIKNYIITSSIIKKYQSYRKDYPSEDENTQDDILNFIMIHVKTIKVQQFEVQVFENLKTLWQIFEKEASKLIVLFNSQELPVLQQKIQDFNTIIDFVQRYFSYVKKINNDFHYLDYEAVQNRDDVDQKLYAKKLDDPKPTSVNSSLTVFLHQYPDQSEDEFVAHQMEMLDKYQRLSD